MNCCFHCLRLLPERQLKVQVLIDLRVTARSLVITLRKNARRMGGKSLIWTYYEFMIWVVGKSPGITQSHFLVKVLLLAAACGFWVAISVEKLRRTADRAADVLRSGCARPKIPRGPENTSSSWKMLERLGITQLNLKTLLCSLAFLRLAREKESAKPACSLFCSTVFLSIHW